MTGRLTASLNGLGPVSPLTLRVADHSAIRAPRRPQEEAQRSVAESFVLLRQTRVIAQHPAGSLVRTAAILFCRGVDERADRHVEQGVELVVGEVGVIDEPLRDEWSLDEVHGQLDVGCGL